MIIGFTESGRTVSESGNGIPQMDSFQILINVTTLSVSERKYRMLYRILSTGKATVGPFVSFENDFDARFGVTATEGDSMEEMALLLPGESFISPLVVEIIKDTVPEDEECFSIQISPISIPGHRELFLCDYANISCEHTICIEDDDGEFTLIYNVEMLMAIYL